MESYIKTTETKIDDVNRGWVLTTVDGAIQKNCANCEQFTQCRKDPKYNSRVCKDYQKLDTEKESWYE